MTQVITMRKITVNEKVDDSKFTLPAEIVELVKPKK